MSSLELQITPEEREFLCDLLENRLGDTKSEMRHTMTTDYRDVVRREENLISGLLEKLRSEIPA